MSGKAAYGHCELTLCHCVASLHPFDTPSTHDRPAEHVHDSSFADDAVQAGQVYIESCANVT